MKPLFNLVGAAALLAIAGTVNAQSINIAPSTAGTAGGPTNPTPVPVSFAAAAGAPGNTIVAYSSRITYTAAEFTNVTATGVGLGSCNVASPGVINVTAGTNDNSPLPSGTHCNITFTVAPGSARTINLAHIFPGGGGCFDAAANSVPCAANPGTVTVSAGPADVSPNVAFTPNPLNLSGNGAATGTLTGTPSGGTGAATTMATCVDDAGGPAFTITPATRTFTGNTTTAQTYTVGCTTALAAASGTITCSQVQSDGTNPAPAQITVNCPASTPAATPEFDSMPPGGTAISLNGSQGGPTQTSQITVSNIEPGTTLTVTPSGLSGPLSVSPAGPSNIMGGASQVFTVSCSTATVGVFNQTLTFTTNDPDDGEGTVTFPITCNIQAAGGGAQATPVPTLSQSGKLIAIFSVLGFGLLGFAVSRRNA